MPWGKLLSSMIRFRLNVTYESISGTKAFYMYIHIPKLWLFFFTAISNLFIDAINQNVQGGEGLVFIGIKEQVQKFVWKC